MITQAFEPHRIRHWWIGVAAAGQATVRRMAAGHQPRPVYPGRYGFLEQSGVAREMDHL